MQIYRYLKKQSVSISEKSDCTVIALAVVAKIPYAKAHKQLADHGRLPRKGVTQSVWMSAYASAGLELKPISINAKTVRSAEVELAQRFQGQKVLLHTPGHIAAWDGKEIQDWSKGSTRKVQFALLATKVSQG